MTSPLKDPIGPVGAQIDDHFRFCFIHFLLFQNPANYIVWIASLLSAQLIRVTTWLGAAQHPII